jgi:hypothetical protein
MRSDSCEAADVPAAAELLAYITSGPELSDLAAVRAVASAFMSVTRRTAACIAAAGRLHGGASLPPAAGKAEAAARSFPAAVPHIMGHCVCRVASGLAAAAQQLDDRLATSSPSSSSSSSSSAAAAAAAAAAEGAGMVSELQQCRASAALLAVLLARSLVVVEDAQQAAAAAAGTTPEQLFAR